MQQPDVDEPVFLISAAAELTGMHAQTLRQYDRLGLVVPRRRPGGGRRYSLRDIATLREIQRLSQDEGINLAGIAHILRLSREVDYLRREVERLRPDLVLLDVQLPDGSGLDLVPLLRPLAEVLLVSSRDRADIAGRVARSDALGFIPKDELSGAAVSAALERRR